MFNLDVSKNRGTPKWMVKIMDNPIKMDDLEVPLVLETPICKNFGFVKSFRETTAPAESRYANMPEDHTFLGGSGLVIPKKVGVLEGSKLDLG